VNLSQTISLFYASADFMGPGAIHVPAYGKKVRGSAGLMGPRALFLKKRRKIRAQVVRVNNPAPTDGPELYELHDEKGNVLGRFRDRRGAELAQEARDRKRQGLRKPRGVRSSDRVRDGKVVPHDDRLRRTTGGTGGTGGMGNG
jgi:hypothetical protein